MQPLEHKHIILLFECLADAARVHEFPLEDVVQVFFCGRASKWDLPTALFVIIEDDEENRFYPEMTTTDGCQGSCYLTQHYQKDTGGPWSSVNRPWTYRYRIMSKSAFNAFDRKALFEHEWVRASDPYREGLDVTKAVFQMAELAAFL